MHRIKLRNTNATREILFWFGSLDLHLVPKQPRLRFSLSLILRTTKSTQVHSLTNTLANDVHPFSTLRRLLPFTDYKIFNLQALNVKYKWFFAVVNRVSLLPNKLFGNELLQRREFLYLDRNFRNFQVKK